jgi:hypothetical protein
MYNGATYEPNFYFTNNPNEAPNKNHMKLDSHMVETVTEQLRPFAEPSPWAET